MYISLTLEDLEGAPRGMRFGMRLNLGRKLRRFSRRMIGHIRLRYSRLFRASSTASH